MKKTLILGGIIFSVLLLSGCSMLNNEQKNGDEKSKTDIKDFQQPVDVLEQTKNTDVSQEADESTNMTKSPDWRTYQNDQYGFKLLFPETWNGYVTTDRALTTGPSVDFGFADQSSLFNISILTKKQWNEIKDEEMRPDYLGENNINVFVWLPAQYSANDNMNDRMKEIAQVLTTFTVIK